MTEASSAEKRLFHPWLRCEGSIKSHIPATRAGATSQIILHTLQLAHPIADVVPDLASPVPCVSTLCGVIAEWSSDKHVLPQKWQISTVGSHITISCKRLQSLRKPMSLSRRMSSKQSQIAGMTASFCKCRLSNFLLDS